MWNKLIKKFPDNNKIITIRHNYERMVSIQWLTGYHCMGRDCNLSNLPHCPPPQPDAAVPSLTLSKRRHSMLI